MTGIDREWVDGHSSVMLSRLMDCHLLYNSISHNYLPHAFSLKSIGEIGTQCGCDVMSFSCNWDNLSKVKITIFFLQCSTWRSGSPGSFTNHLLEGHKLGSHTETILPSCTWNTHTNIHLQSILSFVQLWYANTASLWYWYFSCMATFWFGSYFHSAFLCH